MTLYLVEGDEWETSNEGISDDTSVPLRTDGIYFTLGLSPESHQHVTTSIINNVSIPGYRE